MRLFLSALTVIALTFTGSAVTASAVQPGKSYANCSALLKDYPTGVAKNRKAANRAVRAGNKRPAVNRSVYRKNRKSDRDKDKVACEQRSYR